MNASFVYITAGSTEEARTIGGEIVKEKLAACANIIPSMNSIYMWKDNLENDTETVLILKTRSELLEELTEKVKQLHSYELPCVIAFPIVGGNPDYIKWIHDETREPWIET